MENLKQREIERERQRERERARERERERERERGVSILCKSHRHSNPVNPDAPLKRHVIVYGGEFRRHVQNTDLVHGKRAKRDRKKR